VKMEKSQSRILKISHVSVSQFKMWESLGLAKKNASLIVSQKLDFTIRHPLIWMKKVQNKVKEEWTVTINRSLITHLIDALNFACLIFAYRFFRESLISRFFENRQNREIKPR